MSWRTLAALDRLGVTPSGHPIRRVALFVSQRRAEAPLPGRAIGLSRRSLDAAMQAHVEQSGLGIERGITVRSIEGTGVRMDDGSRVSSDAIFLAVGKHDIRGLVRPRTDTDPTLGLRLRLPPHAGLAALIGDAIELHLFDRGYLGINLQEDGSANICMAVRKSKLSEADGRPERLFELLGNGTPLGDRLAFGGGGTIDAIAAVPYGWRALDTAPGIFRLGDQAAVIPSLAGEGIGIGVASGIAAAKAFADGGPLAATRYQRDFARRTRMPVALARAVWHRAEQPAAARMALPLIAAFPALASVIARATRIRD